MCSGMYPVAGSRVFGGHWEGGLFAKAGRRFSATGSASRGRIPFDEAGVRVNFVSRLLGHTNLTTTSRYLNIHRRGLHMAMQKFEESRRLASSLQDPAQGDDGRPQTSARA